jgi:hypothetical protein
MRSLTQPVTLSLLRRRKKACTNLPGCKGRKRKDKSEPYCKKRNCNLTLRTGHLPAAEDDLSIYWRLARPELVRKWKALGKDPVSSDAFARFTGGGPCTLKASDADDHDTNATAMTQFMLKTCVPAAAAALDRSDTEPVSVLLHREGVNVRHLDKLLATIKGEYRLKTPAARMRVAREMLERTIKNLLRRAMRDVIMKGGNISQLLHCKRILWE